MAEAPARRSIPSSLLATVLIAAALVVMTIPVRNDDVLGHAGGHFAIAAPLLLLVMTARRWPPSAFPVGRRLLLAGVGIFGAGQLLESAGAFGYRGYGEINALSTVHDIGLLGIVGLPVAAAGLVSVVVVRLARSRLPRWARLTVAAVIVSVLGAGLRALIG